MMLHKAQKIKFKVRIKYIFVFSLLISIGSLSLAQKPYKNQINLGAKLGASTMLTETPRNFSETINEFDNKIGIASSMEVSINISQHWETGLEWNFSNLKGNTLTPEFSAEGFQDGIPAEITDPVEYNNHLSWLNFLLRYYFKPVTNETSFNPFVRIGVGILHYESALKYMGSNEIIYGTEKLGTNINTPVFILGTGFKSTLSSRFYLVTSFDINLVDYDYLDVMHNFNQKGNRLDLLGFFAEFKIGIFYNLNMNKNGKGGTVTYPILDYLPFARK